MMSRAFWLGLLVWFAWGSPAFAIEGTVRLKNGGFIHGDVLENLPGERVSVRTSDGTVRNIPWEEVERVEEGAAAAPEPAPAPPPPVTLAPVASPQDHYASELPIDPDEERFNDVTLTMFGLLGILGNASVDVESTLTLGTMVETDNDSDDADLEPSLGGGAQLDIPVHRYFSLAPQVRVTSWRPDETEGDRSALFVDFLVSPRLRFPFVLSTGTIGVPYVQVPLGISYVDLPSDPDLDVTVSPALAVGLNAGFLALLSRHVGLSIEVGWIYRSFSAETSFTDDGPVGFESLMVEAEGDWSVTQATIALGLVVAF